MFSPDKWFGSSNFYNNVATQSLRFNAADSAYLSRSYGSGGNRRKFTVSFWVKRGNCDANAVGGGSDSHIFSATDDDGTNFTTIRFVSQSFTTEKDILQIYTNTSGVADYSLEAQSSFRDTTGWYHFVIAVDTEQSTAANRTRVYVNGVQRTATKEYYATIPEDYDTFFNTDNTSTGTHEIGRSVNSTSRYFDGYLAEFNFVDGTQISSTSRTNTAGTTEYVIDEFGQFKNGVWIPKAYTGSYGTTGYRLQFLNTTNGSGSSSTIGADTSGNGNHWTSNNFDAHDSNFPDSPENNFATALGSELAEPQDYQSYYTPTCSQGNLRVQGNASGWTNGSSNFGMTSGKWYAECRVVAKAGTGYIRFGVRARPARTYDEYFWNDDGTGQVDGTTSPYSSRVGTYGAGDILQVALDIENNAIYFGKNGTWENSATASEIAAGTTTNAYVASSTIVPKGNDATGSDAYFFYSQPHGTGSTIVWNFGQDGSFGGILTGGDIGDEKDSNGIGAFKYPPPTGFLACCASNLPEPTIGPNSNTQADDHHETIIYDGDGNDSRTITGVGFQPDWVWIKNLSTNGNDIIISDSNRGGDKQIIPTSGGNYAEGTATNKLESFAADGFVLGQSVHSSVNESGARHVAWNWHVNAGTTSANTDGSGASVASTIQVNQTAGFSIVTATSPSSGTWTVAHGLDKVPDMVIQKYLTSSTRWTVWHNILTSGQYLGMNENSAIASSGTPFNYTFTDKVIGGNINYDAGSAPVVYYVFNEVEGYSKFGSYDANANADGTYVFTGFRPAWIMIKNTSNANNWFVVDDTRMGVGLYSTQQINPVISYIEVNDASANKEFDSPSYPLCDFLTNGFKVRNGGTGSTLAQDINRSSGDKYIYMAFAHSPHKYANAF